MRCLHSRGARGVGEPRPGCRDADAGPDEEQAGLGRGRADLPDLHGLAGVAGRDAARLLLYRGEMDAEWASYGAEAKERTGAFVAGINAYVDLVEREPARLPIEFRLLGTMPARWRAEDVVRCRAHARRCSNKPNRLLR